MRRSTSFRPLAALLCLAAAPAFAAQPGDENDYQGVTRSPKPAAPLVDLDPHARLGETVVQARPGVLRPGSRYRIGYRLCVDAQGKVDCLEPLPGQEPAQTAALSDALADQIADWRFSPAGAEGAHKASVSALWVEVRAEPSTPGRLRLGVVDTRIAALAP